MVDGRPGTKVIAGALRVVALLTVVGAVVGVAAFRSELLKLVPFVGATGMAPPAIFAVLVASVGLLFWGLADALSMLAEHLDAHGRTSTTATPAPQPARSAPQARAEAKRDEKFGAIGDVPGVQRYNKPMPRVLKWTANVTNGPAYLANPICEVAKDETVTAIGQVAEFTFVETPRGNGWLPNDSLAVPTAA